MAQHPLKCDSIWRRAIWLEGSKFQTIYDKLCIKIWQTLKYILHYSTVPCTITCSRYPAEFREGSNRPFNRTCGGNGKKRLSRSCLVGGRSFLIHGATPFFGCCWAIYRAFDRQVQTDFSSPYWPFGGNDLVFYTWRNSIFWMGVEPCIAYPSP